MLHIKSIPAFNDNYIWLIKNSDNRCAVVDPGDAEPVLDYLNQHDLKLEAILITHHHHDHIGGIAELVRQHPEVNVVGPASEPVPTLTHEVKAGDQIELFGEVFLVLGLPGILMAILAMWETRSCSAVMCFSPLDVVVSLKALWKKCIAH